MPAKRSEKSPGEKLLALYTLLLLQGGRPISLAALAQALDCSKQTVLRLLGQLEASGYGKLDEPIRRGKEDFYRLAGETPGLISLGAKELARLALCRNVLMNLLPGEDGEEAGMGSRGQRPGVSYDVMYKGYIDYGPYEKQYEQLARAIQKGLVCRLVYQKSIFAEPRELYFAPQRIISYHETLSVLGWEVPPRGQVKNLYPNWLWLYIHRCISVALTRRHASGLPEIEMDSGRAADFGIICGDAFGVRLLFNAQTANYIHDRQWSADQKLTPGPDNSLILEMTARSQPELVSWILSFGANVKVLEPDWLRDEIREIARKIAGEDWKPSQKCLPAPDESLAHRQRRRE